jgi:3',5'-cyclic AMP phosphodiesterase CpdA
VNPRSTRRELLAAGAAGAGALALALAGCEASGGPVAGGASGSTLAATWGDPRGTGVLVRSAGEPLLERTELSPAAALGPTLATLAHLTDAHVLDAESPARVPFLERLGPPFSSTFRPQETLTARVLDGAVRAVCALAPDAVIQGGDLIDNAQYNELACALGVLHGARVDPSSGGPGYVGVQSASDADPFYYRPDLDAPRHPGMLAAATHPFRAHGLHAPCYPVLGDHDLLVQGLAVPEALTDRLACGDRAVWHMPSGITALVDPAVLGTSLSTLAPDGLPARLPLQALIRELAAAPTVRVPADPRRRELSVEELLAMLRCGPQRTGGGALLDYTADLGAHVRVVVLDLARREGGSGGLAHAGQAEWLELQLARAGERWLLVFSHQPLESSSGGEQLLELLDRQPRVLAAICGHTHRNRVRPRHSPSGGYWLIETASLIDYPQQVRALRVRASATGVALETWMLDHVPGAPGGLGDISRELSYLDAQGGRPQGFAGAPSDRNVRLYRGA